MKDVIYVEHKNFVSVKENSLCFKNLVNQTTKYIPIEDVGFLIFDNIDSYFSNEVVSLCIENDIGIIFCGKNHSPIAEVHSLYGNRRKLVRINAQIALSQRTRFRLWKKIVSAKILNQSMCVLYETRNTYKSNELTLIAKDVKEGDSDNREAYAAHVYFPCLFGSDFNRGRFLDVVNSALNYGYAILRSIIRKELAVAGFEMSIGIFHRSSENPYNLSDDIIEPFRPFVDAIVYREIVLKKIETFDRDQIIKLLSIFVEKCIIDERVFTISDAIKCCVESLIDCIENDSSRNIKLPSFIESVK